MAKVIMEIPNQEFSFITATTPNFCIGAPIKGTILLVNKIWEDDEDLLACIGIPDGKDEGSIAFWEHFPEYEKLWNKMLEAKREHTKTDK